MHITHIATIYTDLPEKFGLPRQSMLADRLRGEIVFEEAFRDPRALQGIEGFDYLWLVWGFENQNKDEKQSLSGHDGRSAAESEAQVHMSIPGKTQGIETKLKTGRMSATGSKDEPEAAETAGLEERSSKGTERETPNRDADGRGVQFRPLVRPPRLGGNEYMGVFATRSPFRPNPLGLSCVKLEAVRLDDPRGPVLVVSGIDMRSGTKIYDIKPYLPYVESHPDARSGFAGEHASHRLRVVVSEGEGTGAPESLESAEDTSQTSGMETEVGFKPTRVEVGDGFKTPPSGVLEPSSTPTGTTPTGAPSTGAIPPGTADSSPFPVSWSPAQIDALLQLLAQDPRPAYHDDPARIYGLSYAGRNVTFRVEGDTLYLLKIE